MLWQLSGVAEIVVRLVQHADDKDEQVKLGISMALTKLGDKQPELVLTSIVAFVLKQSKVLHPAYLAPALSRPSPLCSAVLLCCAVVPAPPGTPPDLGLTLCSWRTPIESSASRSSCECWRWPGIVTRLATLQARAACDVLPEGRCRSAAHPTAGTASAQKWRRTWRRLQPRR